MKKVRIVTYDAKRPDHRAAFRDLNLVWIEEHFFVEDGDRYELDNPEAHILAPGGQILFAESDEQGSVEVLGTCALMARPDAVYYLAKMAVATKARGRGIGRTLAEAAIATTRALGGVRLELTSNRVLAPAITLYSSLGFVEVPMPQTEYKRANIKMVLDL
jgi:GNAT superfamily N-acetyltransferase